MSVGMGTWSILTFKSSMDKLIKLIIAAKNCSVEATALMKNRSS